MTHEAITVFDIEKDLAADKVIKKVRKDASRENGAILFDPDSWKGLDHELKLDRHKLSEDELRKYAILATEIRQKFKTRAQAFHQARKESAE